MKCDILRTTLLLSFMCHAASFAESSSSRDFILPPHFQDSSSSSSYYSSDSAQPDNEVDVLKQLETLDRKQLETVTTLLLEALAVLVNTKDGNFKLNSEKRMLRSGRSSKKKQKSNIHDAMQLLLESPELSTLASTLHCHERDDSDESSSSSSESSSSVDGGVLLSSLVSTVLNISTGNAAAAVPSGLSFMDQFLKLF